MKRSGIYFACNSRYETENTVEMHFSVQRGANGNAHVLLILYIYHWA